MERVDLFGVAAEGAHGVAHGGEIDDGGDAGEVLHEDAGRHVGDLARWLGFSVPGGEELDVVGGDGAAVFVAEEIFEQDAEGEREAGEVGALLGESFEAEEADGGLAAGKGGGGFEGVGVLGHLIFSGARGARSEGRECVGREAATGKGYQTMRWAGGRGWFRSDRGRDGRGENA